MSKLSTQLRLLNILIDGNIRASKELEEELELKNSTLRYYITSLGLADFQVESIRGKGGGYKLDKKMGLKNILKIIDRK